MSLPPSGRTVCVILGYKRILVDAALSEGLVPWVVVGPWEVDQATQDPRVQHATWFADDVSKPEMVVATLVRAGRDLSAVLVVAPASDEYVITAGLLSGLLAGRPFDLRATVAWRDKDLQKRVLREAGVPVARTQWIPDLQAFDVGACALPFPVVLKPLAAAGAGDTVLAEDAAALRAHVLALSARSRRRGFLLESFVDGVEHQVDAIVECGQITFLSLSRYVINPLEVVRTGQGLCVLACDPEREVELYGPAEVLAQRVVEALSIGDAVIHLEAFLGGDGRFIASECGVRLGGCFTCELIRRKHGVDLAVAFLRVLSGRPSGVEPRANPAGFAKTFLPGRAGRLISAPSEQEVMRNQRFHVTDLEILCSPGATFGPATTNAVTRIGDAVLSARDDSSALAAAASLADWFGAQVRVAEEAS